MSGRDVGEHAIVALLKKPPSAPPFGQGTPDIQDTQCGQAAIAPVAQSTFQESRHDGFFNPELSERIGFSARAERHIRLLAAHKTYTQNKL